ncbi:MAG: peptidoglycan editing factor PgeF [Balneolaceae bacterium]|nr:peptidoglycan editing factor PgeF [Balneolaceae bacterium]
MSSSSKGLQILKPKIHSSVDAWFTLKNEDINKKDGIQGLNLGNNTSQPAEEIEQNRKKLFNELNINPAWFADANQVHGTKVQTINQGGTYSETDGLITQIPGLALAIQVADCAAVLMADPSQSIIAAVHAGWRGAVGGILEKAISQMESLAASPSNIQAFISPCISLAQFEVGNEVAELFPDEYVDYESYKKPHIDLKGFIKSRLNQSGLTDDHIKIHEGCTVTDEENFYSYRREGEGSGRMMGIIKIKR